MKTSLFVVAVLGACIGRSSSAYEIESHAYLSEVALRATTLATSPLKRAAIDLRYALNDDRQKFVDTKSNLGTVLELIRQGARYEDDVLALPPRPLHHFFDPATGKGLSIDPLQYVGILPASVVLLIAGVNATNQASPDWALDSSMTNNFSRKALSNFMYDAYLKPTKAERDAATGRMFETLGRLLHHVQDMAQPQHVRNDAHLHFELLEQMCPIPPTPGLEDPVCPLYRALRAPSLYEQWTKSLPAASLPMTGYQPVYGPTDWAMFSHPRRFWTHNGKGMADFTYRNFFSAGTMRRSPPTTGTAFDMRARDLCAGAVPPCEVANLDHFVKFFPSTVDDQLRPAAGGPNPYAAAESIYSADFRQIVGGDPVRTVNRFTFHYDHAYLLPRAVAYSAGFIDFIFRGEMKVTPPKEGVYAVVDSSAAGCGNPCGFRKLRLKLQNTTPGDEVMGPGELRAIVKYHRNQCHQPDLSGHYGGSQFGGNACRMDESVAVSEPLRISGAVSRSEGGEERTFHFPLGNHIPIDATDVRLQILFRGRLGQEDDAVAITTVDIAEPNFVAVANNTDHYFDPSLDPMGGTDPPTRRTIAYVLDSVKVWFADPATQSGPAASLSAFGGGQARPVRVPGRQDGCSVLAAHDEPTSLLRGQRGQRLPRPGVPTRRELNPRVTGLIVLSSSREGCIDSTCRCTSGRRAAGSRSSRPEPARRVEGRRRGEARRDGVLRLGRAGTGRHQRLLDAHAAVHPDDGVAVDDQLLAWPGVACGARQRKSRPPGPGDPCRSCVPGSR